MTTTETPQIARRLTDQGREREQQFLDAAAALFAERGYAATRIVDICRRAGAAKGLFYWYFPNKLDLFVELVLTMRRQLGRAQRDAIDPHADPLTRVRQGTEATVLFINEHRSYFAFQQAGFGDPALAATVDAGRDLYLTELALLIDEARQLRLVSTTDVHLAANGVVATVSWFTEAWRRGSLECSSEELAHFVGDWVVGALTARSTS